MEVREEGDSLRFSGHAAVFDQTTDLGFMRERVAPGAFKRTIKNGANVAFLYNHDPSTVMARTTSGTLRLSEDDQGLVVDADLDPSDVDVQRLAPKLRRGDVSQMSFGFSVVKEDTDEDDDGEVRVLREVELFDVSPVTYPAYAGTDGGLRHAMELLQQRAAAAGLPVTVQVPQAQRSFAELLDDLIAFDEAEADPEQVRAAIDALTTLIDSETDDPQPEGQHSDETHSVSLDDIKRVLDFNRNRSLVA
jgi:HK97 family phage prohead protease